MARRRTGRRPGRDPQGRCIRSIRAGARARARGGTDRGQFRQWQEQRGRDQSVAVHPLRKLRHGLQRGGQEHAGHEPDPGGEIARRGVLHRCDRSRRASLVALGRRSPMVRARASHLAGYTSAPLGRPRDSGTREPTTRATSRFTPTSSSSRAVRSAARRSCSVRWLRDTCRCRAGSANASRPMATPWR